MAAPRAAKYFQFPGRDDYFRNCMYRRKSFARATVPVLRRSIALYPAKKRRSLVRRRLGLPGLRKIRTRQQACLWATGLHGKSWRGVYGRAVGQKYRRRRVAHCKAGRSRCGRVCINPRKRYCWIDHPSVKRSQRKQWRLMHPLLR